MFTETEINLLLLGLILIIVFFIALGTIRIDQRSKKNASRIDEIEKEHTDLDKKVGDMPREILKHLDERFDKIEERNEERFASLQNYIIDIYKSGK